MPYAALALLDGQMGQQKMVKTGKPSDSVGCFGKGGELSSDSARGARRMWLSDEKDLSLQTRDLV